MQEWPHPSYPPWAHGPGYIISKDIANFIVQGHFNSNLKVCYLLSKLLYIQRSFFFLMLFGFVQLFKLEDVSMGIWIEEYKKQNHTVHYISDDNFNNVGCSDGYVIAHYQNPKHMACLWGKLREGPGPVCCDDP